MPAPKTSIPSLMLRDLGPVEFLRKIGEAGGVAQATTLYPGNPMNSWNKVVAEAMRKSGRDWREFVPLPEEEEFALADAEAEAVTDDAKSRNEQRLLAAENKYLRKRVTHLENYYAHLDTITRAAAGQFPYVRPKYPTPRAQKESWEEFAVFNVSDTQIGELIRSEETGGLETYTYDVFRRRVDRWKERTHLILNDVMRRSVPVHNAGIILGGDIGEGENVYGGQQAHVEFLLNEQIIRSIMSVAEMVQYLAGMVDNLWVWAVPGNHGRVQPTTLDLDTHVYAVIRALLTKQENIRWSIAPNNFNLFQVGPMQFKHPSHYAPRNMLAIHGSNLRSTLGTPYYAADKAYTRYASMLNCVLFWLWIHHHHRLHVGGTWSINGAWPSGNDYSIDKMQGCNRPGQLMGMLHQEVGWTSWRTIHLDDEPQLVADEYGQLSTTVSNDLGTMVFEEGST